MILLEAMEFRYPKRKRFSVSGVSFSVKAGEILSLLGPNGAGKTTLLRILSGLILPSSGTVVINNHNMLSDEAGARRSLGLVLGEERSFYYRLSGAQNLEFFGGLYRLHRRSLREDIGRLLALVGLESDAGLQYMRYSTGMKKRLALARALLHDPQVLLLDEPNSGIDPGSARAIRETICRLKHSGKTILLTTHDMTEAERLSDRIAFLNRGRLVRVGSIEEFRSTINRRQLDIRFRTDSPMTRESLSRLTDLLQQIAPTAQATAFENGISIVYNGSFDMNAVLQTVCERGGELEQVRTSGPTLEDVFLKLAGT